MSFFFPLYLSLISWRSAANWWGPSGASANVSRALPVAKNGEIRTEKFDKVGVMSRRDVCESRMRGRSVRAQRRLQ
ncbi:hypothetical protein HW555_006363 [Spodoptera exigua]|uniref:Secreted protein n=1 Tax=Spodoptera exigua TaxID=7107 RepID=A0A835L5E2_SPOEX|nr:hypothetical protein HW555_006363 [Spodoptera exigua]